MSRRPDFTVGLRHISPAAVIVRRPAELLVNAERLPEVSGAGVSRGARLDEVPSRTHGPL